jgi:hypothetical protein
MSRKFMFCQNPTRVTGTLHEHLRSFVIVSRLILRMINVSGKRCGDSQNAHCIFNSVFSNIVPFMR